MENLTQTGDAALQATLELNRQQREAWLALPAKARLASLLDTHAYMASFLVRVPDEKFQAARQREMARIKADIAALVLGDTAALCAEPERAARFDQLLAAHGREAVEYGHAVAANSAEMEECHYAALTRLAADIATMLKPDTPAAD
jgi:hypothetical protein